MTKSDKEVTDNFTHEGKLYDLGKVRVMTRTQPAFFLKLSQLDWVFKWDKPDPERVAKAKFRWPLLVHRHKSGRWTVVDGLHRLERYRQRGITAIPVKEVTDEMLDKALVSK